MARLLSLAGAPWLEAAESREVIGALLEGGHATRFVGGCVRDGLLAPGRDVPDLDLATTALPERSMELLAAAGIRVLPTGFAHGTVTARLGARSFEITTLRRDVATDGRHAEVAFTDDFDADAARRDLTINAMSCSEDGRLFDPFGGSKDLAQGRIRFVGEARRRITEDHLRILRFFRFFAVFGVPPAEPEALAACTELRAGVDALSGERVRVEMQKLLVASGAGMALALMRDSGVLSHVLPPTIEPAVLSSLPEGADALLRLAALLRAAGVDKAGVAALAHRWRFSTREAERIRDLVVAPLPDVSAAASTHRAGIVRMGADRYADLLRLAAAFEAGDPQPALELARTGPAPEFPITGRDLLAAGVPQGPELGRRLAALREVWIGSDFTLDRQALLRRSMELPPIS